MDHPPRRILLLVTGGGYTHAAPVLELGAVLDARGHEVQFATNRSQTHWSPPFTTLTHDLGPALPADAVAAHYGRLRDWRPADGLDAMLQSKRLFDSLWPETYRRLRALCLDPDVRPDFIIADFFADAAARDMKRELAVPIAVVFPQMPYWMAPAPYIPGEPGFQVDAALTSEHASLASRLRNELLLVGALPALWRWLRWTRRMRRAAGVRDDLPLQRKPDYLVLVNSFFGLETPKDLPPLIAPVGPILSDRFPPLGPDLEAFLDTHPRTLYVSLGTHVALPSADLHRLLAALLRSLDADTIDGIIWALPAQALANFHAADAHYPRADGTTTSAATILADLDPQILLTGFAPQRAVLAHPSTVLFLTHAGGSSANETLYHGCPVLAIGYFFDQLANAARLASAGVGLALDKATLTPDRVAAAIDAIVRDPDGAFARNVLRMRRLARVAAKRGKHRAADLVEEVMYDHELRLDEHARELRPMHLQTADARMPAWRARNWDIWALGLGSLGAVGLGCACAVLWVRRDGARQLRLALGWASAGVVALADLLPSDVRRAWDLVLWRGGEVVRAAAHAVVLGSEKAWLRGRETAGVAMWHVLRLTGYEA